MMIFVHTLINYIYAKFSQQLMLNTQFMENGLVTFQEDHIHLKI